MRRTHLNALKLAIETRFSRKVLSSAECNELSDAVYLKTGHRLNPNTLRRLFGLVKANHLPSYATMNALSQFCGYNSFDAFVQGRNSHEPTELSANESLLLQYLSSLFKKFNSAPEDPILDPVVHHSVAFLLDRPALLDAFQRALARIPAGQTGYFERFLLMDRLGTDFAKGISYYLSEKGTPEAQVYGYSLLCLRAWLLMNNKAFFASYEKVQEHCAKLKLSTRTCALHFAIQLFHADLTGADTFSLLVSIRHFYNKLTPKAYLPSAFPIIELILADALTQIGEYEEALFYSVKGLERKPLVPEINPELALFSALQLYQAIALFHGGKEEEARSILRALEPSKFYFFSRHYHSLFYLLLKQRIQKRKTTNDQIAYLIEQTGFLRFNTYVTI